MMLRRASVSRFSPWFAAAVSLLLASCAETEFVANTAKEIKAAAAPERKSPAAVYKVGKPYEVDGVWYYPAEDYGYSATGIASWYGADFHGRPTANGEIYDMNAITAAHKTLPLPSIVRVTNLENGRSLLVRVNDRGPFVNGRIIDLSRRSAQLLGFEQAGTARVRVEIVPDQSRMLAATLPRAPGEEEAEPTVTAAPRLDVAAEELAPPPGAKAAPDPPASVAPSPARPSPRLSVVSTAAAAEPPAVSTGPAGPTNIYIQAGAFAQFDNANRLQAVLSTLGRTRITPTTVDGHQLFRVRLGPIASIAEADQLLDRIIKAGYNDAQLIVAE